MQHCPGAPPLPQSTGDPAIGQRDRVSQGGRRPRRPGRAACPDAEVVSGAVARGPRLFALPSGRISFHEMAVAAWAAQSARLTDAGESMVARDERTALARRLRSPCPGLRKSRVSEFTDGLRVAGVHPTSERWELVPGTQHERRQRVPRTRTAGGCREPRGTLLHQPGAGPGAVHPRAGRRAATGARMARPCRSAPRRPRLGITGIFLSLSRVLPDRYPLGEDVTPFIEAEHGFGHLLDIGIIEPRARRLYHWSADELGIADLRRFICDGTPCYAWPAADRQPWHPQPSRLAQWSRRLVPLSSSG